MMRLPFVYLLLIGLNSSLFAQESIQDTIPSNPTYRQDSIIGLRQQNLPEGAIQEIEMVNEEHDPNKAAWYSAVVPGLGQAYNKKYWKIPIVWAGIGGFAYFIDWNNDQYQFYRKNLIYESDGNQNGFVNETPLDAATLKSARDQYRRNRDMLVIFGVIFYMLNIVDAHVDAHLIEFDVNQSLSAQLVPSIQSNPNGRQSTGLSLKIKF